MPVERLNGIELLPGSEYVEVSGSGHSVYFEDAPAFNEHVGRFLAQHLT